ncbi:MAG: hypothetical protein M0R05_02425 [Bacilli bacterium]|nr:hypothetical protein [Bacilli bacterium]MDD4076730.1 sigma factor-like helix-turn-helix DNA-binding protein [Bacilli bacterium]MDD4387840.1 sigma factor-like helix-turn-helix DNA-binding protein [Bacilli bacterium]
MDILEKREYYTYLFDFYENLLTVKQRQYFCDYYFNDLSLAEIANCYGISRNAVYDQLNKTYKNLKNFEEKLKLYYKYQERNKLYIYYRNLSNPKLDEFIKKLKDLE